MPRWLACALLTVLLWGGWGFASRKLGDELTAEQTLAISTLGMLPILLWLGRRARAGFGPRRGIAIALAAGALTGLGNLGIYGLLRSGEKAATLVPLTALYPLVTVVLAVLFLRERLNAWQAGGILFSLAAIYSFNVAREGQLSSRGFGLVLLPLMLWGVSALLQKLATRGLTAEVSCFWFLLGMVPVAAAVAVSSPMPQPLPLGVWLWSLGVGFLLGMGNLTLLAAYAADGKASIITPLSGLYPAVTVPLAILFLGERILPREWLGIALSLVGVAAMSLETDGPAPAPVEVRT
jgi:transporter family protein